ncbi:MAG: ABC transporter permease subunit [Alphaproteobacteria bacterium]|nr:ABC transporter permease subunit [Alphaproteobacteria bacterium]
MIERTPILDLVTHGVLVAALVLTGLPVLVVLIGSTLSVEQLTRIPMPLLPGARLTENMAAAWTKGDLGTRLMTSAVVALGITAGKISVSILSAFAIVYFDFRFKTLAFWLIFVSLMLPVEVRIVPTFEVVANALAPAIWLFETLHIGELVGLFTGKPARLEVKVNLLNSYTGLILPLVASATGTFLFRQFFMTIPRELAEAARIDGAGPMRFFRDMLLPLSLTNIAALSVILFLYGWNQYLWPLLMTTTSDYHTAVLGVSKLLPSGDGRPEWNVAMAGAVIVMIPPIAVVVLLQRLFVKGLIEADK